MTDRALHLSDAVLLHTARDARIGADHVRILLPAAISGPDDNAVHGAGQELALDLGLGAVGIRQTDVTTNHFAVDAVDAAGSVLRIVAAAVWSSKPQIPKDERVRVAGIIASLAVTWLIPQLLANASGPSLVRSAAVLDIWTHLKDPNLGVATIARRTAVSERALYAAFSDGPERLGALVRRIRMDREAAELRSLPRRRDITRTVERRWARHT
jgi:AraC-like DNA-binding protein